MALADGQQTGVIAADGTATLRIRPTSRQRWTVTQVSPEAPDVGAASGALRKNGFLIAPFVAPGDSIAGDPPVELSPNDTMTVEWIGGEPGAQVRVWYSYDDGTGL